MHRWFPHVNSPSAHFGYVQFISSDDGAGSLQSGSKSQTQLLKMHRPLRQRNSFGPHVWKAVGKIFRINLHYLNCWSSNWITTKMLVLIRSDSIVAVILAIASPQSRDTLPISTGEFPVVTRGHVGQDAHLPVVHQLVTRVALALRLEQQKYDQFVF